MALTFEWDPNKATTNLTKHGISFEDASTVFGDRWSLTIPDPVHSAREERFVIIGSSHRGKLLVVVHTERDDNIFASSVHEWRADENDELMKKAPDTDGDIRRQKSAATQ
jgi:hypothetical protein